MWGWGREGRAAYRAIRSRLPALPLTLFCAPDEAAQAGGARRCYLADRYRSRPRQRLSCVRRWWSSRRASARTSLRPGAVARGTRFIGGTALWLPAHPERTHALRDRHQGQEHDHRAACAPAARRRPSHRARRQYRIAAARTARRHARSSGRSNCPATRRATSPPAASGRKSRPAQCLSRSIWTGTARRRDTSATNCGW